MAITVQGPIDTRKMRYTGEAMRAFKVNKDDELHSHMDCEAHSTTHDQFDLFSLRPWLADRRDPQPPKSVPSDARNIGSYPLTSELSSWVRQAFSNYQAPDNVRQFVEPFAMELHQAIEKERAHATGLHNLDLLELVWQHTLQAGAAILLAADSTSDPVSHDVNYHSSRAGNDGQLAVWGKLLTGLDCDPPITGSFPLYLMMCQAFGLEPNPSQTDYVYATHSVIDFLLGEGAFTEKISRFHKLGHDSVPSLDDSTSGQDRSFWRISEAYLRAMNYCENSTPLNTPRLAAIPTGLDPDLLIAMRALDSLGLVYMCTDGAGWLDDQGIDSILGSGLVNDIMDLHTDIQTGETRSIVRLLYPDGWTMDQAMQSMATLLSGMLGEFYRGHRRARFDNREDGRVSVTSPSYSFTRARHRRVFEIIERYVNAYPDFWEWTWEIYRRAKEQVTEAGLAEPLVCALKRSMSQGSLPDSPLTKFYDLYYELVEDGTPQMDVKAPLGVHPDLAHVVRGLHTLWHRDLLSNDKKPGWGAEFDAKSDRLFEEAGEILTEFGGVSEEMYRFAIAYGRLSVALPYIAYHTIDAIILAHGPLD